VRDIHLSEAGKQYPQSPVDRKRAAIPS
jgi:hypothetical protein